MTGFGPTPLRDAARWALCAAVVLSSHGALAWAIVRQLEPMEEVSTSGALVIELAPISVARADLPADMAPGPEQVQSDASPETAKPIDDAKPEEVKPEATVALPLPPLPQVPEPDALPVAREETAEAKPETRPPPSLASAMTSAPQVEAPKMAASAAASVIGAPGPERSVSVPRWSNKLLEAIERNKRYPAEARGRGEEGTAHVAFTIDRMGQLIAARIEKSSGFAALDAEALDILKRASPFPKPPTEIATDRLPLTVPIRFRIRG